MQDIVYRMFLTLPVVLISLSAHEFAHAYAAYRYGDNTALRQGRLTLNPTAHIDLFGTFILPLLCLLMGGFIFGYAKPVPINPSNFKDIKKATFWVSFAGPIANIILVILSGIIMAFIDVNVGISASIKTPIIQILATSILFNTFIAVLNLIPLPPLDGSKMLMVFLKHDTKRKFLSIEKYSMLILMLMLFTGIFGKLTQPFLDYSKQLTMFFYYIMGAQL